MITLPWKRIGLALFAVVLIAVFFYFKASSKRQEVPLVINPAFAEYISVYTSGVVSSGASLSIGFSKDVVDSSMVGQESNVRLFDFSPSLSGKAVWVNRRTVTFEPRERMTSGQAYRAKFHLSEVVPDVPEQLATFQYSFQVIPQNFEVKVVNTKPYSHTDFQRQKIDGVLHTADYAQETGVKNSLKAYQDGKPLEVSWTHGEDGLQHHFTIEQVVRKEEAGSVSVKLDGGSIGIDRQEEMTVEIPSLQDFKLMRVHVVQSPSQYVVLQFSDPLKQNQNLNGLITIDGLSSLDFDVHDNEVWVYPPVRQNETKTISVSPGIRNVLDKRLASGISEQVTFEQVKPAVRFTGKGSILPHTDGLVVPFEAVNLKAVDVQIIRIHEDNVLQFFQVNNLEGNQELRRVGNRILRKKISLENSGVTDPGKWNRYTLDISSLLEPEPGAIYEVKLGFRKAYSTFACETLADAEPESAFAGTEEVLDDGFAGEYYLDYYDRYYYDGNYDWRQRDNPCHSSYYTTDRQVRKNILASDLGITAKLGEAGATHVFVTDLRTARPMPGVEVAVYSFQLRELAKAYTDKDGKIEVTTDERPFALVARNGTERGYLRLVNSEALMISSFDVSGDVVQQGLKGFLYGERGVWRPGDSLHLTFILEDESRTLPSSHPVIFELANPQGQLMTRLVRASAENGFYRFACATAPDAPTGNWLGRVKVGGTEFVQTLKVETVKPNRLKIRLDFGAEKLTSPEVRGDLQVNWLHGAPGKNLKAQYEVTLVRQETAFDQFPDFNFDDPTRQFESETQLLFDGSTDEYGRARVESTIERSGDPSGLLHAVFRGKVFEESGNFSIDRFTIPFHPYASYVGIRVPEGEQYSGILYTDTPHEIALASVDVNGNGVSRNGLEVQLYKLDWRWWWDNSYESLANFVEGSYSRLVKSEEVKTQNGKGRWTLTLPAAEYGRYLIRVCDPVSGHCAGQVVYVDEPGWYGRARANDARGGANLLSFSTDKTAYNIGEKIHLTIPGFENGRALVSIENGSEVLKTWWVETQKGETRFSFDAVPEMTPNVYVHVSLIQPHDQTQNDLPVRLYGLTSVKVEDPSTHLHPEIAMPEVLAPGEEVAIRVSEKKNRKMTFTLAMVDEGLLDLTRFKTPDAWRHFYGREALGVRTWDVYDQVVGAFGTTLERFISIGGDDAIAPGEVDPLANRFKPVVKFYGPYTIEGGSKEIRFTMPDYIGSVKTMVVAGADGAYGKAEKISAVRKPLMVLATLPRVLGPEEMVSLPVTVFSGENDLAEVKVRIHVKGPASASGAAVKTVSLKKHQDMTVDFALAVKPETGVATVEVTAESGGLSARDVIEIQVRNPNVPVTRVEEFFVEAGKEFTATIAPVGMVGTNSAALEVSTLPAINLESRMRYLLQYPHGCVEQITSSAFPQLFLDQVKALSESERRVSQYNIKVAIEQLRNFVQADGGFAYWPGVAESTDSWGTSYAGHFLVEAEKKGFYIPPGIVSGWKNFQRGRAAAWRRDTRYFNSDLLQAYRLYTLAVAGAPELGAMNRMREEQNLSVTASWMLAAAYATSGQPEAAHQLITNLPIEVKPYRELGYTYGSTLRDKALILETLVLLKEREKAFDVLKEVCGALGDNGYWMSTQETAMSLRAVAAFAGLEARGELKFSYRIDGGKEVTATTALPLAQVDVPVPDDKTKRAYVRNDSKGDLFVRMITSGTPARGMEDAASRGMELNVAYTDLQGNAIDATRLEQGTEFVAEVTVVHAGLRSAYENLALTQVFPSGWEINNLRLAGDEKLLTTDNFRYQDIRDDRVFTYFDLAPRETKTFRLLITAAYAGDFYLPAVTCEAMYDRTIYARIKGAPVSVTRASGN